MSKGLATTCRDKTRNPIEYFANWLLEYNKVQKEAKKKVDQQKEIDKLIKKHQFYLKSEQRLAADRQRKLDAKEAKK